MRPTTPPSWLAWYRRLRPAELPRAQDAAVPRARAPGRVAVYTSVFRGDKHLPYLRLEEMLGHDRPLPTPSTEWLKRLNLGQEMWRAHISPDLSKDSLEYHQRFHNYSPVSIMLPPNAGPVGVGVGVGAAGGAGPRRGPHGAVGGGTVWGGWAAGAVLLALLVLVVRAAEKCLDKKFFNYTRRPSEEWHTPNVTATSLQHQGVDGGSVPNLDDSDFSSPSHNADLPPPYSECAPNNDPNANKNLNKLDTEEPPPPYSACIVSFSNKDIPTVHIHRQPAIEEPHTSSDVDNVHNDLIETRQRTNGEPSSCDEAPIRVELVFDNGRIVERTIDIDRTDNVPEIVANVGEAVIGNKSLDDIVPYADDAVADTMPDRVVFV